MNVCVYLTLLSTGILFSNAQIIGIGTQGICPKYGTEIKDCINDDDGNHKLPEVGYINSYEVIKVLYQTNLTTLCRQDRAKLTTLIKCVVNSYRRCADDDFKTLIPTETQYEGALTHLCDNKAEFTALKKCMPGSYIDCYKNKQARLKVRDYEVPDRSTEFIESETYHCRRRAAEVECLEEDTDFNECTGASRLRELYNKLKPSAECSGSSCLVYTTSMLLFSFLSLLLKHL